MLVPICVAHMVEMTVMSNAELVQYPAAQYLFSADLWSCPTNGCEGAVLVRADRPAFEGHYPLYQEMRVKANYTVWNG